MKQLYSTLLVLLLACTAALAQDNAKTQDIKELLRLTKAGEMGMQAIKASMDAMRKSNTTIPTEVWDEFERAFSKEDIINLTAPVYDKHFTHQEIKNLIALYGTPLGQKLLEKTPIIMQESMAKGQQYGQEVAMHVIQRMQTEGRIPKD